MTTGARQPLVRRILIGLDATGESLAALEVAAQVAARLEAELAGLFVEDVDLLRLAALPYAREVGFGGGQGRRLDPATVERQMRGQAAAARRALAETAERRHLRWSFRVARGRVEAELMAAAAESDLVALGKAFRPLTRRARLGRTARAVATGAPAAVLLAARGPSVPARPGRETILVTYDGSPCAERALMIAARLARAARGGFVVFLVDVPGAPAPRREAAEARIARSGVVARYRHVEPALLPAALQEEHGTFLVVAEGCLPADEARVQRMIEAVACPVLLIREGGNAE